MTTFFSHISTARFQTGTVSQPSSQFPHPEVLAAVQSRWPDASPVATDPTSLGEAVQAAAQRIDECQFWRLTRSDSPAFQPKVLLALLAYCYARQVYASQEIHRLLAQDPDRDQTQRDEVPSPGEIRQFRDLNMPQLESCLTAALLFVVARRVAPAELTPATRACIHDVARRRIHMAARIDAMRSGLN